MLYNKGVLSNNVISIEFADLLNTLILRVQDAVSGKAGKPAFFRAVIKVNGVFL